jgi:uncharacterized membrane protein (GlpM family)
MWQYIPCFIAGGSIVAFVAYLSGRGNPLLATLVANIPVLFLINIFLVYRTSGMSGSMIYAEGVLLLLPVFILFVIITILLLPRLGMPMALLPSMLVYLVTPVMYYVRKRRKLRQVGSHSQLFEVGHDISAVLGRDKYLDS